MLRASGEILRPGDGATAHQGGSVFALYLDEARAQPTPYNESNDYVAKAKDRMDRTFDVIAPHIAAKVVLDVGASPFYLLYRAKQAGAARCHGLYFANDEHPLRNTDRIYSDVGPIELGHANVEEEGFPFATDTVDVVTACEILEHFDSFPVQFASEVRRVLKPGGHLAITVPNVCSIANVIKLLLQKNIYMKYRSDVTGRHKHEYTLAQLKDFVRYMGMEIVEAGFMPSPTSDKYGLRPIYRAIAKIPGLRYYSPVLFILARQPSPKPASDLHALPESLYDRSSSIEE
jgi:SAM-dependent methyltransferase